MHTVTGKFSACLEGASEDGISLDTWLEGGSAWDFSTQLLAFDFFFIAPKDVLCLLHVLLGWSTVDNWLTVVEEGSFIGLEVCTLNDCVGIGGVDTEEFVDRAGRNWPSVGVLVALDANDLRYRFMCIRVVLDVFAARARLELKVGGLVDTSRDCIA